jgi:hypothetical protein
MDGDQSNGLRVLLFTASALCWESGDQLAREMAHRQSAKGAGFDAVTTNRFRPPSAIPIFGSRPLCLDQPITRCSTKPIPKVRNTINSTV